MTTTTKIELPEILIVRTVPIDVPNIQHRHVIRDISFDDLIEYGIYCKHIVEPVSYTHLTLPTNREV